MKHLLAITRFELFRLRRLSLGLFMLLLLTSLLALGSGTLHLQHQTDNARALMHQQRETLTQQRQKITQRVQTLTQQGKSLSPDRKTYRNPATLAQRGHLAILPEGPLALVSLGQTALQPQAVKVTLAAPALLETQENLQHPLQLWTGQFDLVFVLVYLLPLLLITLSFDLTAGEQASGNLRLLLVQGGSLNKLVTGKLLARILILIGMLAMLTFLSWGVSLYLQLPFAWGRWLGMMAISLAYGLCWLGLALLLNALRWQAAAIAAALAAIWLAAAWLIPGSSQQGIQALAPVPSRIRYLQSYRAASEAVRQNNSRLMGRYLEDHPELAGGADNRYALLQLAKEQALAKAVEPVVSQYQTQLTRQQQWATGLQYLSPVTVFENTLSRLAGSDLARQQQYREQVADFQAVWQSHFLPLIQTNHALQPEDLTALPQFTYREPDLTMGSLAAAGGYLLGLATLLLALGRACYRRYSVLETEAA